MHKLNYVGWSPDVPEMVSQRPQYLNQLPAQRWVGADLAEPFQKRKNRVDEVLFNSANFFV